MLFNVIDYVSVEAAVGAAAKAIGGKLVFPAGIYPVTTNTVIPESVDIELMNGAALHIAESVTLSVNGGIIAGYHCIFNGSGIVSLTNARIKEVYPEWWSDREGVARGDGSSVGHGDDAVAITKAVNAFDVVAFRNAVYRIASTIVIPQGRILRWNGSGYKNTILQISPGITGVSYVRDPECGASDLNIHGIQFAEDGLGQTSIGISFQGSDNKHHDNWLKMYDCAIFGLDRGVFMKYCGHCHFVGCYARSNNIIYCLDRDACFLWFDRCMNIGNNHFIYAKDPLADGISNGIMVHNCASVFAAKEDIHIVGWQAVYITGGGGLDLGGSRAGMNSVYLEKCMDFSIIGMWIASDKERMTQRNGIHLSASHSGVISGCSLVNNTVGIRIDGHPDYSTRVSITDNKFEANVANDILFGENVKAVKITNNHFMSVVSRSKTHYEIYAEAAGSDFNIIKHNTFSGQSYSVAAGSHSMVSENIFEVPN